MPWESEFLVERGAEGDVPSPSSTASTAPTTAFASGAAQNPLRSLALDAQVLDESLVNQLRTEVARAAALLPPRAVLRSKAEIHLLIEVFVLALTVGLGRPTPGMEILSLKYRRNLTGVQRALLCTLGPGAKWASERFEVFARSRNMAEAEGGWEALAWRGYCLASLSSSLLNTLNLCLFLWEGRHSTLAERALGVTKTYDDPMIIRSSALGLLDDHLFWSSLYDFVSDMTPLATRGLSAARTFANILSIRAKKLGSKGLGALGWLPGAKGGAKGEDAPEDPSEPPQGACGVCGTTEIISLCYAHPCRHPYCYYCLAASLATRPDFACKVCGRKVQGISR